MDSLYEGKCDYLPIESSCKVSSSSCSDELESELSESESESESDSASDSDSGDDSESSNSELTCTLWYRGGFYWTDTFDDSCTELISNVI